MLKRLAKITGFILTNILLVNYSAIAQTKDTSLTKNTWHDYDGKLGNSPIQMSLYVFNDNTIKGNYVYNKYCTKITLEGKLVNGQVQLTEFANGKPNGYFTSTLWCTYKANACEGTWTDANKNKNIPFNLSESGEVQGSFEHRYPDVDADSILENFMKKIKQAVLSDNKEWLSKNIDYPIYVTVDSKRKAIKNENSFIDNYNKIMTTAFKEKIKNDVPCNLYGNYQGYMLGRGEIWVNSVQNSNKLKITGINN